MNLAPLFCPQPLLANSYELSLHLLKLRNLVLKPAPKAQPTATSYAKLCRFQQLSSRRRRRF